MYGKTGSVQQGLRAKLISLWGDLRKSGLGLSQYLSNSLLIVLYFLATVAALVLWQPVTAFCKFYRDSRSECVQHSEKTVLQRYLNF